jgi:hypothetical protein
LSDDDTWNQKANWFESQSFENKNAAAATVPTAARAKPPRSSSQQALGTVSHPIPVDSDLDSRERDVLRSARTKKQKDQAETVREQDVLARNKSLSSSRRAPPQQQQQVRVTCV